MAWLLDTNVVSELRRPNPSHRVAAFISSSPLDELYISVVTLAEIRYGVHKSPDPALAAGIDKWLQATVRPMFTGRVLAISEDVMLQWRIWVEQGRKVGHTHQQPDLILAATAFVHNMTLVTRNVKDFTGLGLSIHNPW